MMYMQRISKPIGLFSVATCLLLTLLMGAPLRAQTDRGGISGTITDASGAAVPGASVSAIAIATSTVSKTTSTGAGTYNIQGLESGAYRLEVEHAGFKKTDRSNVIVDVGNTVGVDLVLQVGAVTQTVEVSAAAPILKTESGDSSTVIAPVAFSELPVSAAGGPRSPIILMSLVPGVVGANGGSSAFGISVNGGQQYGTEFQVDGITNYMAELSGDPRNLTFNPDMVQEQSLVTGAYSAEFGSTSGGIQRYEIKSGTNSLHGTVSDYLKNTALDSRGFYNTSVPIDHQNEIGFTVGGPVVIPKLYNGRNKTFFFFGYDHWHEPISGSNAILSVPTAAMLSGDYSQQLGAATGLINPCDGTAILAGQIFDPTTTQTVSGQVCRTAFPGNVIPSTDFSTQGKALLAYFPSANLGTGYLNNYRGTVHPSSELETQYMVKGDQYFGSKHHLSLMNGHYTSPSQSPNYFPDPVGQGTPSAFTVDLARLTEDWSISASLMNQLKLGFNNQYQAFGPDKTEGDGINWYQKLGIPGYTNALENFPGVTFGTYGEPVAGSVNVFGRGFAVNGDREQAHQSFTYVLSDTLYWTKGRHNLKFGIEYRDIRHGLLNDLGSDFNFGLGESGSPANLTSTGSYIASALLGDVDSGSYSDITKGASTLYYWKEFNGYVQDDFKVKPNLTLNLGVRYTLYVPLSAKTNYSSVDLSLPNPSAGGLLGTYIFANQGGQGSELANANIHSNHLAPRLGFAYRLSDRVVVRGGYAISYFPDGPYGGENNIFSVTGYASSNSTGSPDGYTPPFTLAEGFPPTKILPVVQNSSTNIGGGVNAWAPSASKITNNQTWNLSTQTRLTPNLSLDVAYVGGKGTHLYEATPFNVPDTSYVSLGNTVLDSLVGSPTAIAAGITAPWSGFNAAWGPNATVAQALNPYPQYGSGMYLNSSFDEGNSTYNSLQVKLEKRLSSGVYLLAAYTWSKSITDSTAAFEAFGSAGRDYYDRALDKGVSSINFPQVLTAAFVYDLPFGPGKKLLPSGGPVGKIVGGWAFNGFLTYHSGSPIGATLGSSTFAPQFDITATANTISGVAQKGNWTGDPATGLWLNPAAFAVPGSNQLGTSAAILPNLRGPGWANEDLSLSKNTHIAERFNLEIRLEAFDAFNRVVFGNPASDISVPSSFGVITSQANSPRTAQIAMRLVF